MVWIAQSVYVQLFITCLLSFAYSSAALFQPDGQRLCVQADQQLHQLFHAWRPKGTMTNSNIYTN